MQRHIHPPGVSERSQVSPSVVGECVEVGKLDEVCDLLADMISEGVIHLLNMLYPFLEEEDPYLFDIEQYNGYVDNNP